MNNTTAAIGGTASAIAGLALLAYIVTSTLGGRKADRIHCAMGVLVGSLLLLGGGFLGAIGDVISTLGGSAGQIAVTTGTGLSAPTGGTGAKVNNVGLGGVALGIILLAGYIGLWKSKGKESRGPFAMGAVLSILLAGGGGIVATVMGVFPTTGNTLGAMLLGTA